MKRTTREMCAHSRRPAEEPELTRRSGILPRVSCPPKRSASLSQRAVQIRTVLWAPAVRTVPEDEETMARAPVAAAVPSVPAAAVAPAFSGAAAAHAAIVGAAAVVPEPRPPQALPGADRARAAQLFWWLLVGVLVGASTMWAVTGEARPARLWLSRALQSAAPKRALLPVILAARGPRAGLM